MGPPVLGTRFAHAARDLSNLETTMTHPNLSSVVVMMSLAAGAAACDEGQAGEPVEPSVTEAELDQSLQDGKYDKTSNSLATWMGSLDADDFVQAKTSSAKRYHGYTLELAAGQKIGFKVTSKKASKVKVYGPATSTGAKPKFASALVTKTLSGSAGAYSASFEVTASKAGLYGIVYWPTSSSSSNYTITSSCVAGCSVCQAAFDECDGGEGFCGCLDSNCDGLACKPYAQEGDFCGGFTLPQYHQLCDPSLDCVTSPVIADAPGTCSNQVTVAALLASPSTYDGHWVSLQGEVKQAGAWCSLKVCAQWNPCCNACGSSLRFFDASSSTGLELVENGVTWGCQGDGCDAAQTCTGSEGALYLSGIFNASSNTVSIEVSVQIPTFTF
jgi:hypothetical protein